MTADVILERAREQTVRTLDRELEATLDPRRYASLSHERERVLRPTWEPPRPARRMPSLWQIACYWAGQGTFGAVVPERGPHCFRCRVRHAPSGSPSPVPRRQWNAASGFLERAHIVDRCAGGLDGPQNLVPLCWRCHKAMPEFDADAAGDAIAWVAGLAARLRASPSLRF